MTLWFIRVFFFIICGFVGYQIGDIFNQEAFGAAGGAVCGIFLIITEASLRRVSMRGLSSMVFGLLLGIFMAELISKILLLLPLDAGVHAILKVVLTVIFSYLGAVMALRGKDEFNIIIPYVRFKRQTLDENVVLLDTSVIIDGRIADIYKTNFIKGRMVVPRFVLQELQRIADSDDPMKRQRGRRGMEILRSMQKDTTLDIKVHEEDLPEYQGVDTKLVKLAKIMDASICTTDYNLNRMATIQGLQILNINELVNAVKPVVFPGEEMEVRLVKEGKEPNQAVAFLDDGTMVVVAEARPLIGQKVKATVTSVLQTQAGRMIFAKLGR